MQKIMIMHTILVFIAIHNVWCVEAHNLTSFDEVALLQTTADAKKQPKVGKSTAADISAARLLGGTGSDVNRCLRWKIAWYKKDQEIDKTSKGWCKSLAWEKKDVVNFWNIYLYDKNGQSKDGQPIQGFSRDMDPVEQKEYRGRAFFWQVSPGFYQSQKWIRGNGQFSPILNVGKDFINGLWKNPGWCKQEWVGPAYNGLSKMDDCANIVQPIVRPEIRCTGMHLHIQEAITAERGRNAENGRSDDDLADTIRQFGNPVMESYKQSMAEGRGYLTLAEAKEVRKNAMPAEKGDDNWNSGIKIFGITEKSTKFLRKLAKLGAEPEPPVPFPGVAADWNRADSFGYTVHRC